MNLRLWPWIVAVGLAVCQTSCVFLALGEKQIADCSGVSFDNVNGKRYELVRVQKQDRSRRQIDFNITKDCEVDYKQDLTGLSVKSIEIRDSRSASGAIVIITTTLENKSSDPVTCTAPLVEFEKMDFICPEQRDLSFVLAPLE
ncbi:MAG TPA: hypothetical protein VM425_05925 [Myxococcota bacterium]|nr:hypothetical protein [Myxococcota bacterium]